MRKLALALILLLALPAQAQFRSQKSIICDEVGKLFTYFTGDPYNEKPIWMAKDLTDNTVQHTLLSNFKTGTWTMLMSNDKYACVLAAGEHQVLVLENLGDPT